MPKKNLNPALAFFERMLGCPLDSVSPVGVDGGRVTQILWPLNAIFRPQFERIRSIPYRSRFEEEADQGIEVFAEKPEAATWATLSPGAWRVLLERHQQMIMVALLNTATPDPVTYLPRGLPTHAELPGVMLALLHRMKLPFPPADRSALEPPEGDPPVSLQSH